MGMIDNDLKEYLAVQFKALSDKMDGIALSTAKDIDHHRSDILDIFTRLGALEKLVGMMQLNHENHMKEHDTKDGSKKFSVEMWIIVGIFIVSTAIQIFKG